MIYFSNKVLPALWLVTKKKSILHFTRCLKENNFQFPFSCLPEVLFLIVDAAMLLVLSDSNKYLHKTIEIASGRMIVLNEWSKWKIKFSSEYATGNVVILSHSLKVIKSKALNLSERKKGILFLQIE